MTANEFKRRLRGAKPKEIIPYFRGFTGDINQKADELRRTVAKAYIDGLVTMTQRKTGVSKVVEVQGRSEIIHEYDYLALKL